MGALEPRRLAHFRERFACLKEDAVASARGGGGGGGGGDDDDEAAAGVPAFMYGSHYSNVGTVLYYLLRLEPVASLAVELQGGRFDVADRLFGSVEETWANVLASPSDLKVHA